MMKPDFDDIVNKKNMTAMRKVILLFLFINIWLPAYNQVIKGTVFDQKTHEAIVSATVYFNGTSVGALTDKDGRFELDVTKNVPMPLTVSTLGYNSATLNYTEYSTGNPVIINLIPKVFELNEVVVKAKPLARERNYNLMVFKNEFLGTSVNAQNCEILNEDDITFNYGSDRDTLKAFAKKPIQIFNKKLGYKITYYLDKFEFYKRSKSFVYKGNLIFNEDLATNNPEKPIYERRRKNSYMGSRMQFFRALWANDLKSTGFVVNNSIIDFLDYSNIVIEAAGQRKYLNYKENLGICYYSKLPTSYIVFRKEKVYFEKNGYFDESGIIWEGKMANQRIGEQLPYDYIPDEK
jgi:hypothetical protein